MPLIEGCRRITPLKRAEYAKAAEWFAEIPGISATSDGKEALAADRFARSPTLLMLGAASRSDSRPRELAREVARWIRAPAGREFPHPRHRTLTHTTETGGVRPLRSCRPRGRLNPFPFPVSPAGNRRRNLRACARASPRYELARASILLVGVDDYLRVMVHDIARLAASNLISTRAATVVGCD